MMHPATQATLKSILLSGVSGYIQNTPSPPPGLAPIDAHVNGVSDCSKAVSPLSSKVSLSPSWDYQIKNLSCISLIVSLLWLSLTRILCACVLCSSPAPCTAECLQRLWQIKFWPQLMATLYRKPVPTALLNRCPASPAKTKTKVCFTHSSSLYPQYKIHFSALHKSSSCFP